ncbi:tRNA-guanine transglycosylase DpdA [Gorillibacterium sp. sgz5001074]|uniref:tRNA-guanine transglycosylase DpdA n=1 Tax=Gorillibacterium sp. sgz5001074 TaxID=3446695 RepID=UPI003F681613
MGKRILVVTSCTGEKLHKPENQLTIDDFMDSSRLREREFELLKFCEKAGKMYTGKQHKFLMDGIDYYRNNGGHIELDIISAGYGLINENDEIVPYEVTFNTMDSTTIKQWSRKQGITTKLQERIKQFDLVFFLLGDKYLQSVEWPLNIDDHQKFIFFAGDSSKSKVLVEDNYYLMSIGEREAKKFRCGLIGIKGYLFAQLLVQISDEKELLWERIAKKPELVRDLILSPYTAATMQLELFQELKNEEPLLKFYTELYYVAPELVAKNYKAEFRFFMPENDDRVDPNFDFLTDHSDKNRNPLINDVYAHEIYGSPQYDGILISKVNIDAATQQKRELIKKHGIRDFLRLPSDYPIMGDCGAFSYITNEEPPYSTEEIIQYYEDLGFDYGVSIDHLIVGPFKSNEETRNKRFYLTLEKAKEFINVYRERERSFQPIGVAQGWSPDSFREAVQYMIDLGYNRVALGGLAREQSDKIFEILKEIAPIIPHKDFKLHLFGVARDMRTMYAFHKLGVTSFDSASPLRRAWLGSGHNYHTIDGQHYSAIRIPEAKETAGRVKKMLLEGKGEFEQYKILEQEALLALRRFSKKQIGVEEALNSILKYDELLGEKRESHEQLYREVLEERPWEKCNCKICAEIGIDVVVFRGNNRNRRRGFHNTLAYYEQVKKMRNKFMN